MKLFSGLINGGGGSRPQSCFPPPRIAPADSFPAGSSRALGPHLAALGLPRPRGRRGKPEGRPPPPARRGQRKGRSSRVRSCWTRQVACADGACSGRLRLLCLALVAPLARRTFDGAQNTLRRKRSEGNHRPLLSMYLKIQSRLATAQITHAAPPTIVRASGAVGGAAP